ncbi:MAG: DUF3253 domain-containing protein [Kordiimonadaceae bacterium]|nr:DUF3253 domain-containing protein [Kordiimonadaceae bacterium]MBO6568801.1 DUF3253 domain-containing protein [Kordiimonadaceae bacterium]MBO6965224.1 DUF3253 domain-containing protein [Kordiimonadaceae bacterium]
MIDQRVEEEIIRQVASARSVAPRDVAVALVRKDEDWRKYLPRIRQVATVLHADGRLLFIRKKKSVPPAGLKGVFRLAAPEMWERPIE